MNSKSIHIGEYNRLSPAEQSLLWKESILKKDYSENWRIPGVVPDLPQTFLVQGKFELYNSSNKCEKINDLYSYIMNLENRIKCLECNDHSIKKSNVSKGNFKLKVGDKLRIVKDHLEIDTRPSLFRTFSNDSRWTLLEFLRTNRVVLHGDVHSVLCQTYSKDLKFVKELKMIL